MSNEMIILLLAFVGSLICVMTPIIKLNSTITKLDITLTLLKKQMEEEYESTNNRLKAHGQELDDLKEKFANIDKLVAVLEERKHECSCGKE